MSYALQVAHCSEVYQPSRFSVTVNRICFHEQQTEITNVRHFLCSGRCKTSEITQNIKKKSFIQYSNPLYTFAIKPQNKYGKMFFRRVSEVICQLKYGQQ